MFQENISKKLNIFSLEPRITSEIGSRIKETKWTGITEMLRSYEADISISPMKLDVDRADIVFYPPSVHSEM